ncbi:hypothetical protein PAXINDRAFT_157001 [Paxillus involutus ATCC 200175]|uniref:Uncharacterized protein n=1 Tax=Paxillus involutus ATCC 200175 TaxID=664439 RepID=A0A0C9TNV6_PAXIN|nr:hypothetical protein PAXINDRAFT_157001 [Paxillus involutus ATCC 200175]
MGAKWTSKEQHEFLSLKKSDFMKAQLQLTLKMFWSTVSYEFFEKWPEINERFPGVTHECLTANQQQALGKFVEARKGQIRSWFYHTQREESKARATDFSKCITKIMGSTTKGTRGPSAVEMFMQTEEFVKVREASEEASESSISSEIASTSKPKKTGPGIAAMKKLAKAELSSQSDKFKLDMINHAKEECKRRADVAQAELEALRNPDIAQRVKAIEGLGGMFGQLLETVFEATGWHASVYVGGPDPRVKGDIRVYSFHHGQALTGSTFRESLPNHHERVVKPFTMFLQALFPGSNASQEGTPLPSLPTASSATTTPGTPLPSLSTTSSATTTPAPTAVDTPATTAPSTLTITPPSMTVPLPTIPSPTYAPYTQVGSTLLPDLLPQTPSASAKTQYQVDVNAFPESELNEFGLPPLPADPETTEGDDNLLSPISAWNCELALHQGAYTSPPRLRHTLFNTSITANSDVLPSPVVPLQAPVLGLPQQTTAALPPSNDTIPIVSSSITMPHQRLTAANNVAPQPGSAFQSVPAPVFNTCTTAVVSANTVTESSAVNSVLGTLDADSGGPLNKRMRLDLNENDMGTTVNNPPHSLHTCSIPTSHHFQPNQCLSFSEEAERIPRETVTWACTC